mmetsp:Transcript_6002/g.10354  ORF Transcript_6002/g.10354 Transcript_6002/m.10354 type:complete len:90 (+) Transcript_6002:42-311(+)|eukprot:CAMPEP_0201881064 /NCGR_PEP_ID=MMETSP0902-20130614/11481_1 /ASSEMBLY_ACC=CAM_ASM_000551 /TAXON_ID=420261 /ORGANISM="Thalassiosira antarctica, Strain CCMP982" /LENGTH=89 /DNA_ID=CAMNT_0048409189 /DNA_START=34 /DNA_END=303 /DNA_ORIENTATION=+
MRTTCIVTLLLSTAQAFSPAGVSTQSLGFARAQSTAMFSSPLDGMNRELLNEDDDDVPMTKAEMRAAEKEMKAEMKRLKEEAAAAAKEE